MYKIIGADQKEYGPVSAEEIRRWVAEGRANGQTLLQAEGQTDWRSLSSFPEFGAPAQTGSVAPAPGVDAARLVSGPATALLVVGILCVVTAVLSLASNLMGAGTERFANLPPQWRGLAETSSGPMGVVTGLIGLAVGAFIIFASTKMRKLESHALVMTAAILASVPCLSPCCCFPLPVTIWLIVVLNKPEVKSSFH